MNDLEEHKQRLIRTRDHVKARIAMGYHISTREHAELYAIEAELRQLEAQDQQQPGKQAGDI